MQKPAKDKVIEVSNLPFDKDPYFCPTSIPNLLIIKRPYYPDERGSFQENFRIPDIEKQVKFKVNIAQSSLSEMTPKTLKGIHAESQHKILTPISGEYLFVEVDLRVKSPMFKKYLMFHLDLNEEDVRYSLFIPEGCGNALYVLKPGKGSLYALLQYSVTAVYDPETAKMCIRWDDPDLAIPWPNRKPIISNRDLQAFSLKDYVRKYRK